MRAHRSPVATATAAAAAVLLAFLGLLSTSTHTVVRGETLARIASAHGTTVAALARANSLSDPDVIIEGSTLTITSATPDAATSYSVRSGDTLGRIAARHGVSLSQLISLNDLRNPNLIRTGQTIKLPAGASTSAGGSTTASNSSSVTPAGGATTHIVRTGDTVAGIASRYGIPQSQLVAANGIVGGRIYASSQLRLVPSAGSTVPVATTYSVRSGDTLLGIAIRYGTTISSLQSTNGISDPDSLAVGRTLKIPAGGTGGGSIACPVVGSVSFINDWGFPRSGGRFHQGNDLFAPKGTRAVATVSGTMSHTVGTLAGNQARLDGDDGVTYYYMHLDRFGPLGRVSAGDTIGYVGTTGNAAGTAAHVHFEVHPGAGEAVNPYPRLVAAC